MFTMSTKISLLLFATLTVAVALPSPDGVIPEDEFVDSSALAGKLKCKNAGVQSPRDLSTGATGTRNSIWAPLNVDQAKDLVLTNVHFHKGSEHKSDEYSLSDDTEAWEAEHAKKHKGGGGDEMLMQNGDNPRPGFMCSNEGLAPEQPYEFKYCHGVEVGKTYEVHYVYSSAGSGKLADGLSAAAGAQYGLQNPMIVVKAMVYHIVSSGVAYDLANGWDNFEGVSADRVMYPGSTTGTGFNNKYCSPYTITWHVDKRCNMVTAASFDTMCKDLKAANEKHDLHIHGSRTILSSDWVVPADQVLPIMSDAPAGGPPGMDDAPPGDSPGGPPGMDDAPPVA